jgi:hypothetical protein
MNGMKFTSNDSTKRNLEEIEIKNSKLKSPKWVMNYEN